jgi:hypothetical protein
LATTPSPSRMRMRVPTASARYAFIAAEPIISGLQVRRSFSSHVRDVRKVIE